VDLWEIIRCKLELKRLTFKQNKCVQQIMKHYQKNKLNRANKKHDLKVQTI
jgi:hypothetical protein